MLKTLFKIAAVVGALTVAAVPFTTSIARAQGDATEPPKAPDPSAAKSGGSMSKGGMMKKSKGSGMMMKKSHKKKM